MAEKNNVKKKGTEKKETVKKKVSEIFEVEKNGKEKIIETHGIEEEKKASEEQIKKENHLFKIVIIAMIGFILMFVAVYAVTYFTNHFEVKGVKFEVDKVDLRGQTLYKTSLPVVYNGANKEYNFYLRTDPRELEKMVFNGNLSLKNEMVINATESLNCNGDGIIAIANLVQLYEVTGLNVIKNGSINCDNFGGYNFLKIGTGNETEIDEYGNSGGCYNIQVNNCEILPATERFMLEGLIRVNKALKK